MAQKIAFFQTTYDFKHRESDNFVVVFEECGVAFVHEYPIELSDDGKRIIKMDSHHGCMDELNCNFAQAIEYINNLYNTPRRLTQDEADALGFD
jgi:hypothetical protein